MGFEAVKSHLNLLGECADGHKKSVEELQRRNGKLLQQIDCLQDDYERVIEQLEKEGNSASYLTPKLPSIQRLLFAQKHRRS